MWGMEKNLWLPAQNTSRKFKGEGKGLQDVEKNLWLPVQNNTHKFKGEGKGS